jgi:hypothetical protein
MERYFYAPGTLFPNKEKILLQCQWEQNGRYFYALRTLFPYKEKILLQRQREQNGRMERYFYAPRPLFPYKEKILLQRQQEQNRKVFLRSWNIISLQGKDSPPAPEETEW